MLYEEKPKQLQPILESSVENQNRLVLPQVSQEQLYKGGVVFGILLVTAVCSYILWALLATNSFLPYQSDSLVPQTMNIIIFVLLVTIITSGALTLLGTIVYLIYLLVLKKHIHFNERLTLTIYFAIVFFLFITLLLHVFKIVHFLFSLLCFVAFWGIVVYVQYRRKNRLKKYISTDNRRREIKDSIKIPGE